MSLKTVLTDPESFFDRQVGDPDLRTPALVVLVVGLIGVVASVPVFRVVLGGVPEGTRSVVLVGLVVGAVVGLLSPFVGWLLYAGAFHLISIPLGGEGEFRDLFAYVGWGYLPRVLGALVSALVLFVAVSNAPAPDSAAAVRQFGRQFRSNPLVRASTVVGILVTLWQAYIWTYAVAAARDLDVRRALLTVALPVVLSLGASVASLVGVGPL